MIYSGSRRHWRRWFGCRVSQQKPNSGWGTLDRGEEIMSPSRARDSRRPTWRSSTTKIKNSCDHREMTEPARLLSPAQGEHRWRWPECEEKERERARRLHLTIPSIARFYNNFTSPKWVSLSVSTADNIGGMDGDDHQHNDEQTTAG